MTIDEHISNLETIGCDGWTVTTEAYKSLQWAIKALEDIPKYKDAYNKGWDDGAKASYEHLKMCEEENDVICRKAVLVAIDVKSWEFCNYLISKNRNDEQESVSHFADNLRECILEQKCCSYCDYHDGDSCRRVWGQSVSGE